MRKIYITLSALLILMGVAFLQPKHKQEPPTRVAPSTVATTTSAVPSTTTILPTTTTTKPNPVKIQVVPTPVIGAGQAQLFVYGHESGNSLCKINGGAIDCNYTGNASCGIGQAYPCQKLRDACGYGKDAAGKNTSVLKPNWMDNYECQNQFFTSYALGRYGSWENAMRFWQSNRWW